MRDTQTVRAACCCVSSKQHAKHNSKHHVLPLPVSKQHAKHNSKHHVLPLPVSKQHAKHNNKHHVLPLPVSKQHAKHDCKHHVNIIVNIPLPVMQTSHAPPPCKHDRVCLVEPSHCFPNSSVKGSV